MNTDQLLIKSLKDKKQRDAAFKILLNTYQQRLYWHVRKLVLIHDDANDVLQNTFIKIHKNIATFKGNSTLHTWMYRIAYNEAINFLKAKQKRLLLNSDDLSTKILNELKEDPYFDGNDIQFKLQEALLKLPKKQRQVFIMKYYDDLKFKEISEIIGTSEGALKASYHLAVKKIERFLTN
ncbi:RNA polymerase sigma factor [Aquimarina agarivorans]|uniref:RNA polymerase sigma factor n=1 Tax=Aquimarina agarivorans TaxID=980584 RepID=UPI000248E792|nr:RNA polymerase sigma factor [Aquimarina agarivorans]